MHQNPIPTFLMEWVRQLGLEDQLISSQIESGRLVAKILKIINPEYNLQILSSNTAINRITNWTTIIKTLKKLQITITQQDKTKLINGNYNIINQILTRMYDYYIKNKKQIEIDLSKINKKTQIEQSNSLLQLFILSLMKYFNLTPKQCVALLLNQCQFLTHILVKGFKNQIKPIQQLITQFTKDIKLINNFCQNNRQNLIFFIYAIKPTFISKSDTVSQIGLELMEKFLLSNNINDRNQIVKDYFISIITIAVKRHPHLCAKFCYFIITVTDYSKDLLNWFKSQTDQLQFENILLTLLTISKQNNQINKFIEQKNFKEILTTKIKNIQNPNKIFTSLNFLLILTSSTNNIFQDKQQNLSFIESIQKVSLIKKSQNIALIQLLFAFLALFGKQKNQAAPTLLKILIGRYQINNDQQLDEIYLANFEDIILEFPSIPVSVIVQTINAKAENNVLTMRETELGFFATVVNNLNIDVKTVQTIYTRVFRVLIQQPAYSYQCTQILLQLTKKSPQQPTILDLTLKLLKISLSIHYATIIHLTSTKTQPSPQNLLPKTKNLLIEHFIYKIISCQYKEINNKLQSVLCYSLIQVDSADRQWGKGLRKIIAVLGDPHVLVQRYEKSAKRGQLKQQNKQLSGKNRIKQGGRLIRNTSTKPISRANQLNLQSKQRSSSNKSTESLPKQKPNPMQLLSTPFTISSTALKGLQKYQQSYRTKLQKLHHQQTKKKQQQDRLSNLQKALTRKLLQKGLDIRKNKNQQYKHIYEFGVKEKQLVLDAVSYHTDIPYYQQDDLEQWDIKLVQYTIKKYQKVLKLYYTIYTGHNKQQNLISFDLMAHKFNLLYSSNLMKMFKQHMLDQFISIRQIRELSKKINNNLNKKIQDPTALDYQGFQLFIIQSSYLMFTRPPTDLRSKPLFQMIQQTISRLKLYAGNNKINEALFEDPDIHYLNETEAVKQLNKKLQQNQDYILPEGYKKIVQPKILVSYHIAGDHVAEQYRLVYELIDELLYKCLGVHIVEPFTTYQTVAKARPTLYHSKRKLEIDVINDKLSIFMKKQVSKLPFKDRQIGKQVATVIDQIIQAVQFGHDKTGMKFENKVIRQKKQIHQQQIKKQLKQHKKWIQRDQQIKSVLIKYKQTTNEKQKQQQNKKDEEKKKIEQNKKKKQDDDRKVKEKVQYYLNKKKQQQQQKKIQQNHKKQRQKQSQSKKKKQSQQLKKRIQQSKFKKQQQQKQKKKQQETLQKQRKTTELKKQNEQNRKKKQLVQQYKYKKSQLKYQQINQSKTGKDPSKALDPISPHQSNQQQPKN